MRIRGKNVLIIGAGKTGVAAAKVLHNLGACVTVCDIKRDYLLTDTLQQLKDIPVKVITGGYPDLSAIGIEMIVISPGVPLNIPPVVSAAKLGIPVWSEIELASTMFDAPIVAVTGTNGKTTTTSLLGQMFQDAGMATVVAGNIGVPLVGEVNKITSEHVVVLEVSSFQLEAIHFFRPKVGIVINLTPDHLDRHRTMEEYKEAKQSLFRNQGPGDFAVLNFDDVWVKSMAAAVEGEVIFFSLRHTLDTGAYLSGKDICFSYQGETTRICSTDELYIKGGHNVENVLSAICAGMLMGIKPESIRYTLKSFKGVKHRLQLVDEIEGVKYINDSKGTNPDATIKAVEAYSEPVILILGGKNKGSNFGDLAKFVSTRVKEVIVLGEAAPEIIAALEGENYRKYSHVETLEQAVAKAARIAQPGDVVLLSPACASWDMFNNYEERGDLFISQVAALRR